MYKYRIVKFIPKNADKYGTFYHLQKKNIFGKWEFYDRYHSLDGLIQIYFKYNPDITKKPEIVEVEY